MYYAITRKTKTNKINKSVFINYGHYNIKKYEQLWQVCCYVFACLPVLFVFSWFDVSFRVSVAIGMLSTNTLSTPWSLIHLSTVLMTVFNLRSIDMMWSSVNNGDKRSKDKDCLKRSLSNDSFRVNCWKRSYISFLSL